jgi:hypothetical protein
MGNFTPSFKIPELPARYLDLPSEVWIYRPRSANGELSRKIPARTARLFEVIMTECVFSNSVSMRLVLRATLALLCCRLADRVNTHRIYAGRPHAIACLYSFKGLSGKLCGVENCDQAALLHLHLTIEQPNCEQCVSRHLWLGGGRRRRPAPGLSNNSLSTDRRLTGIVMNAHPVFAWCREIPRGLDREPIKFTPAAFSVHMG